MTATLPALDFAGKTWQPTPNREAWLSSAIEALRVLFRERGEVDIPKEIAVSVGWPGGKSPNKTIGQCWAARTGGGTPHVYISPVLGDPIAVLGVLVHELVHAWDDCKSGHKGAFTRLAKKMGLTGKMTATTVGPDLKAELATIAEALGPYPHKKVTLTAGSVKKQTTRMIKVQCPEDGYTARTTRKWLDEMGTPICPCGYQMKEAGTALTDL